MSYKACTWDQGQKKALCECDSEAVVRQYHLLGFIAAHIAGSHAQGPDEVGLWAGHENMGIYDVQGETDPWSRNHTLGNIILLPYLSKIKRKENLL